SPSFLLTNSPRNATPMIRFDLHGGLSYLEYLTRDDVLRSHRQFGVDAGMRASFFSNGPYSFSLFDNYVRTTQPPYASVDHNLDRDSNEVGLRADLKPGGGRLVVLAGYLFGLDYFEVAQLQGFNLLYHRFDLRGSWKFFPKTALYIAADE